MSFDLALRFGLGVGAVASGGGGAAGMAAPVWAGSAPAPAVEYHPHSQTATLDGNGKVTSCPDLRGLAAVSGLPYGGGAAIGPTELTDALGRKFWRFFGTDALFIANALAAISARAYGVFSVWRVHKHRWTTNLFCPRYLAYTDDLTNTTATVTQVSLQARVVSSGAPSINQLIGSDATNGWKMVPGCQLNASGFVSRTTALGGQRGYVNNDTAVNATQTSVTTTGMIGGVIGSIPAASNGLAASQTNAFDLYYFGFWNQSLTNVEADAIASTLVDNWAIPALTKQLVMDGDSLTDCIPTTLTPIVNTADNVAMVMTHPGASYVPDDMRVINLGTSGNQVTNLQTKKNAAQSVFGAAGGGGKFSGGAANNLVSAHIGTNDMGTGGLSAATHYANMLTLINSATAGQEGYLQRGWRVAVVPCIARGNAVTQAKIESYQALTCDAAGAPIAQFLTDTGTQSGGAYDGLLSIIPLHLIEVAGDTKFLTLADTTDTAVYDIDATHQVRDGIILEVSGGDTPSRGYGAQA